MRTLWQNVNFEETFSRRILDSDFSKNTYLEMRPSSSTFFNGSKGSGKYPLFYARKTGYLA